MNKRRNKKIRFAVCITDSEPDLELLKIYQVLPDESAARDNYVRIIDESGEDYLYPANYFVFVEVRQPAQRAIKAALRTGKTANRRVFRVAEQS